MRINRCMNCMEKIEDYPCPYCGCEADEAGNKDYALPCGTILQGRYLVGRVLGRGGFGITYIGLDLALETKVAIKEFYPNGQVTRNLTLGLNLLWNEDEQAPQMRSSGVETFLREARKMAKVDRIPEVVRVRDTFLCNETAYIIMDFVDGETLKRRLERKGVLSWGEAERIFIPAISAMEKVHRAGLIHRDISPDNLMLQPDGSVSILDLGAAKDLKASSGVSSMQVAKSGFSPIEQYTQRGGSGPWTDVYAMAATMYYALTGVLPPTAVDRLEEDTLRWDLPSLNALPENVRTALRNAMQVFAKSRTQSMQQMLEQMQNKNSGKDRSCKEKKETRQRKMNQKQTKKSVRKGHIAGIAAVLAVCILFGGGFLFLNGIINKKTDNSSVKAVQPSAETVQLPDRSKDVGITPAASEISLWVYPIGGWGDQQTVDALMAEFKKVSGITVKVEYLTYMDGDNKVNTAIEAKTTPDLIMESPERLAANWGSKGKMVNIAAMFDETDKAEINPAALSACFTDENTAYVYPVCMMVHCMAINKTVFEGAGAMQYIDEETRTWTTESFWKAMDAVYAYTNKQVGVVFCGGQGGDQGNRALINNLYGGTFANADHTEYTWTDPNNATALQALLDCPAIVFDPNMVGGDEIAMFYNGTLNMATCWNIAQQGNPNSANTGAGKTMNGDEIMCLSFPSQNGTDARLYGSVWGFGIFDNGDAARIEAAKIFIKYFCDSKATADAVRASRFFAVRDTAEGADLSDIWADNEIMSAYSALTPLMGDYYQITPNWPGARAAWRDMLQQVGAGENIPAMLEQFCAQANKK